MPLLAPLSLLSLFHFRIRAFHPESYQYTAPLTMKPLQYCNWQSPSIIAPERILPALSLPFLQTLHEVHYFSRFPRLSQKRALYHEFNLHERRDSMHKEETTTRISICPSNLNSRPFPLALVSAKRLKVPKKGRAIFFQKGEVSATSNLQFSFIFHLLISACIVVCELVPHFTCEEPRR